MNEEKNCMIMKKFFIVLIDMKKIKSAAYDKTV